MTDIRKDAGGRLPTIEGNETPQEDYTVNNTQTLKPSKKEVGKEFKPVERTGKKKGNNFFS